MERSVVVLIFKNMGDVQNRGTYRGIKLTGREAMGTSC